MNQVHTVIDKLYKKVSPSLYIERYTLIEDDASSIYKEKDTAVEGTVSIYNNITTIYNNEYTERHFPSLCLETIVKDALATSLTSPETFSRDYRKRYMELLSNQ